MKLCHNCKTINTCLEMGCGQKSFPRAAAEQAAWEKEKERMQLQIDALYAEALRYKTLVEQAAPEAWVDEIMSLAHRWAQASYMKGLRKPYEDFEPIKRKMRELLRAAPAQEGKK